ncbi:MAG: diacylglycerol kinase family protein [Oscillospiraceae bacterium]
MFIQKSDVQNLAKSFSYAFKGITYCIKNERNMRIHFCMTILVAVFSYFYKTTSSEFVILTICIGFVISSEMVNTAIETLVNLESPCYNSLAKIAKDVAAGAVAISAIVALVAGCVIFMKPNRLLNALTIIALNPIYIAIFVVLIVASILFIFNGPRLYGEKTTRVYDIKTKRK